MVEITIPSEEAPAGWTFDVFLSFRGEDTRKTFVDHLYSDLARSGIITFKDDERLERGKSIAPELLKAIKESMIAVIVFSKNYSDSSWCLEELAKIMDCRKYMGQTVIPIFYDVDPSQVRKQKGHFGEKFREHESNSNTDKVEIWRQALKDAANLSGFSLANIANGHESKCIEQIVQTIWKKLLSTTLSESEDLVGMKSRIEEVTSLMGLGSNVGCTVGICGLSGIGKSTLAGAVYDKIKNQFDVAYFLDNVGEVSKKDGLICLQEKLLSKILLVKDLQIMSVRQGIKLMKGRLHSKRVLLVLDDVDSLDQLEVLAGSHEWFGPGSRIMITTRDKHLLVAHKVEKIHEASVLEDVEATKLFHWKAFNGICPTKDFEKLSVQVMQYASGLPLALKIFGSALCGRDMAFWEETLVKLRKQGPKGEIVEKLKIGFDGLEREEKETFLDIACLFEGGEKGHIERKLDSFKFYPTTSIPILVDRSLIYCSNGRFCMHQLIREMGRRIVRKDFPREPEKHSRLWDTEDIEHVLAKSTGTENVEGIVLNPRGQERIIIEMGSEAFKKMTNLRLLEIHNVSFRQGPQYPLPDGIRWIVWDEYPLNSLPTTFEAYKLVGLELYSSGIKQLWKGRKNKLDNLKYVDLSYSKMLIGTSHLGEARNLDTLILEGCTSLEKVDQSVGVLKKLVCLNLNGCEKLRILPDVIHWESLEVLNLRGCFKLQKFPEIPDNMDKLLKLNLNGTAIKELPSSIGHIRNLVSIKLRHCKNLVCLPSTICTLKHLKSLLLSGCSKLENLPEEMSNLECLENLLLSGTAVTQPPSSIGCLKNLKSLSFRKFSPSSTSCWSWFHMGKRQKITRSLVLPPMCGLSSLKMLDLSDCNMSNETIPCCLGSLFSLKRLLLKGNNFVNLPSLSQLSQLEYLVLDHCKLLKELPELPSRTKWLYANECASMRVSVNRLTKSKMQDVRFQNCRKLVEDGESEVVASTLWHQIRLQVFPNGRLHFSHFYSAILPGREIPEWFSNHTTTGPSISVSIPSKPHHEERFRDNFYYKRFKGYGYCVVLEVIDKAKPLTGSELHGSVLEEVGVEISMTEPGHYHPFAFDGIELEETDNIIGVEHVLMGFKGFNCLSTCDKECSQWQRRGVFEASVRSLSPNTAVVKKWGIRVVENDYDIPESNQMMLIDDGGSTDPIYADSFERYFRREHNGED